MWATQVGLRQGSATLWPVSAECPVVLPGTCQEAFMRNCLRPFLITPCPHHLHGSYLYWGRLLWGSFFSPASRLPGRHRTFSLYILGIDAGYKTARLQFSSLFNDRPTHHTCVLCHLALPGPCQPATLGNQEGDTLLILLLVSVSATSCLNPLELIVFLLTKYMKMWCVCLAGPLCSCLETTWLLESLLLGKF